MHLFKCNYEEENRICYLTNLINTAMEQHYPT